MSFFRRLFQRPAEEQIDESKDGIVRPYECGICLRIMAGKHFLCQNNHSLCGECLMNVNLQCPFGRCDYAERPERDRKFESRVRAKIKRDGLVTCRWVNCNVALKPGRESQQHKTSCLWRQDFRSSNKDDDDGDAADCMDYGLACVLLPCLSIVLCCYLVNKCARRT